MKATQLSSLLSLLQIKDMTRILLSFVLIMSAFTSVWAQKDASGQIEVPVNSEGKIYYEGVVKLDSTTKKDELYRKGREWFVNTYVDAKEVLQLDDKTDGKMIGKGIYKYSFFNGLNSSSVTMGFTLNLDVKDGRYRYRIYNFNGTNKNQSALDGLSSRPSGPSYIKLDYDQTYADYKAGKRAKYNGKIAAGMDEQVKGIIASLEKAMRASSKSNDF
jgi:hypothetical protein